MICNIEKYRNLIPCEKSNEGKKQSSGKYRYGVSCLGTYRRCCVVIYHGFLLIETFYQRYGNRTTMMHLVKSGIQMIYELLAQYEQFRINAENEFQAMSSGALNPRFLAKIKKTRVDNKRNEKQR